MTQSVAPSVAPTRGTAAAPAPVAPALTPALASALASVREASTGGALGEWTRTNLGAAAQNWLASLPQAVLDAHQQWGFTPESVHPASLRSLVVIGTASPAHGGGRAVLKVEPCPAGSLPALDVLARAGVGPLVLARSESACAYLLGWLDGAPLATDPDRAREAIRQVTRTVRAITAVTPPASGPDGGSDAVPTFTAKIAADVATTRRLLGSIPAFARPFDDALLEYDLDTAARVEAVRPGVLVHGDLIAKNTLLGPDGTLRIFDPTPCIGPAEFDIAHLCARISAAAHVEEHLTHARMAAVEPDLRLPVLELDPDLLGWLVCHTARVYYAYKVAMRQDVSGDYLRLVTSPTLEIAQGSLPTR